MEAELSQEEIDSYYKKAAYLCEKYKVEKVYPIVMIDKDTLERVVCYVKEPDWTVKIKIMDQGITQGLYTSADHLRTLITLKEDSDPRTYSDERVNHKYKMGVVDFCLGLADRCVNQIKKN